VKYRPTGKINTVRTGVVRKQQCSQVVEVHCTDWKCSVHSFISTSGKVFQFLVLLFYFIYPSVFVS